MHRRQGLQCGYNCMPLSLIEHVVFIAPYSFQRPTERVAQSSQSSDSTDSGDSLQPSTENNTPLVPARPNVRMFLITHTM